MFFPIQIKALRSFADFPERLGSSGHFHGEVSQIKALRSFADLPGPFCARALDSVRTLQKSVK